MPRLVAAAIALVLVVALCEPASASDHGPAPVTPVSGATTKDGAATWVTDAADDNSHAGSSSGSGGGAAAPQAHVLTCSLHEGGGSLGSSGPSILAGAVASNPTEGSTYIKVCTRDGVVMSQDFVIYTPAAAVPDPAVVAADLAQQALAEIVLPTPAIASNPPNALAVINVPVWMWVGQWTTPAASASAGGVTATVSAVPQQVRWAMGDGHDVVCAGPGTPYDMTRPPDDQSTACSYSYVDRAGDMTVTAVESWHVTYTATNGQGGDLGVLTRTATMPEHVHQLVTAIRQPSD
jgi:hypothetical protein